MTTHKIGRVRDGSCEHGCHRYFKLVCSCGWDSGRYNDGDEHILQHKIDVISEALGLTFDVDASYPRE